MAVLILSCSFLSLRPTLSLKKTGTQDILVLIDNSESMAGDGKINQLQQTLSALRHRNFRQFIFSESLSIISAEETIVPRGRHTDIAQALEKIKSFQPAAVMILTDGNHNYGKDPIDVAKDIDFQVYCLGIGKRIRRDAEIVWVETPTYAYYGDKIRVIIRARFTGYSNEKAKISLFGQNKKISFKEVTLNGSASNDFEFEILPKNLGRNVFEVKIDVDSDDRPINNNRQFHIEVLKERVEVLYFTSNLSKNLGSFAEGLKNANYINLSFIAEIARGNYYLISKEGIEKTEFPEIGQFDVIIMDNVDFLMLPQKELLASFIGEGGGLLILAGENIFTWSGFLKRVISLDLSTQRIVEPIVPVVVNPFSVLKGEIDLPPFNAVSTGHVDSSNVIIILETKEHFPLMGFGNYLKGKVFLILGYPLGQWGFRLVGLGRENPVPALLSDIIRFLSPLGARRRICLNTNETVFNLNEGIEFIAQTYNRGLTLEGSYEVMLEIKDDSGKRILPMVETKLGHHLANFIPTQTGNFKAEAKSTMEGVAEQSNAIEFIVNEISVEKLDTGLNEELLVTLAKATGGEYLTSDNLRDFKPELKPVVRTNRISLDFTNPIFYIIVCAFFVFEWFLRKRRGEV